MESRYESASARRRWSDERERERSGVALRERERAAAGGATSASASAVGSRYESAVCGRSEVVRKKKEHPCRVDDAGRGRVQSARQRREGAGTTTRMMMAR